MSDRITSLLAQLGEAIREQYGVTALHAKIYTAERPATPLCLYVVVGVAPRDGPAPEGGAANATERRVLRAVADLEQDEPTGPEISDKARLKNDPHFRKLLFSLRARGLLGGEKGDHGYPITPAGLDAISQIPPP